MGNICMGNLDKQQRKKDKESLSKNFPICQFTVWKNCTVDLILGTYRCHKGGLLLVLALEDYLEFSTELRDYSQNFTSVMDAVIIERKKIVPVTVSRNCPYKKMFLCILPPYNSKESNSYLQQFENMMNEVIETSKEVTIQASYTFENTNGIPNQTIMAVLFQKVLHKTLTPFKLSIISSEAKLLNMFRFELMKIEGFKVGLLTPNDKIIDQVVTRSK